MKKYNCDISVVIPTYKDGKFVNEAVSSVLKKTSLKVEVIIVNDGPTKNLWLTNYQLKHKNVVVINNKQREYPAKTRNKALNYSNGKYIAILDADDYCINDRLRKQAQFLDKNNNIFVVGSGVKFIDEKGKEIKKSMPPVDSNALKKTLEKQNCIAHSSVMYRNVDNPRYRTKFRYAHDYDLFLRFISSNKGMAVIDEYLVVRRLSQFSIGETKTLQQMLFAQKAKEFYWQRVKNGKDDYEKFDNTTILKRTKPKTKEEYGMLIKNAFGKRQMIKCRRLIEEYNRHSNERAFWEYKYLSYLPKPVLEKTINLVRTYGI